jgi:hypothetical protein
MAGVSRLVLVASAKYPRYSEADLIELNDGRLLLALGRKEGSADDARGSIIGLFSGDRGATWDDEPHVIQAPFDDAWGLMSVSLCRSPRGVHLIFLARGPDAKSDTRVYQIVSADEGKSWSKPQRINVRGGGYHIVNNARVIRTTRGRMIVPVAFCDDIRQHFNGQIDFCLLSDDDGVTWRESAPIALGGEPLMEPGVAECADGSLYMTIRTKLGVLYESRSRDGGATWTNPPTPTKLISPAAPSTVARDPSSNDLWMIWINRDGKATWKQRTPLAVAVSHDHGVTWEPPREIESDPHHGYGYVSVDVVKDQVLLTYYDWADEGQKSFANTNLRQRTVPLAWFRGQPTPPVFKAGAEPVLRAKDQIISANSGLIVEKDRWRLWYTAGTLSPKGEVLSVRYAESHDRGQTWKSDENDLLPHCYHPSAHRDGDDIILYAWRRDDSTNGLFRYVSSDGGKTFAPDPDHALIAHPFAADAIKRQAGDGCVSNDAFDIIRNDRGTWEYFAACLEKASDPRTIIKHDNAAGWLRFIGRSASADGVHFTPPEIVIQPDYAAGDPFDTQFYGLQVFRRRGFYLGLLHVFHVESQTIQPEWAWSHDGQSWARTNVPCIALGDEGRFDSRMILFGSLTMTADELIWLYSGSNWRHNAFRKGAVTSAIGRATLALKDLDAWLDSLPQP